MTPRRANLCPHRPWRQAQCVNTPGRGTRQEFSNIRRDAPEQYRDTTAGGQLAEFPHSRRDATAYAATPLRRLNPRLAGHKKRPGPLQAFFLALS